MQDETNWLIRLLSSMPPAVGGVIMAMFVSILRVVYDREEASTVRIGLEALICGSLTLAGGSAAIAMGLDDGWHLFIGGMVGFIGSAGVRKLAYTAINRKIGGDK